MPGSIPVGAIVETRMAMGEPAAGEPVDLFLPANIARQFVGISVGIGRNRRQKLLQIQMVMELGGYRPGAPDGHPPSSANVHFRILEYAAVRRVFLVSGEFHGILHSSLWGSWYRDFWVESNPCRPRTTATFGI